MGTKIRGARGRANAILDQQYQVDLESYYNNVAQEEEIRELKDKQSLQQYEYQTGIKEAQEQAQTDAYIRSNEVYQDNLKSINFYADTARSRVQLGLDEEIASLSFQLDDLDRDFTRKAIASAFADTEQQQIITNATEDAALAQKELMIQRGQRKAEFDAKLGYLDAQGQKVAGEFDIEARKLQSETRYNQLNNQLESIVQKGAAQARGTKGRSANRVINSIAAMSGVNTQRFNDSLYRAEQSIEIQKTLTTKQKLSILGDEKAEKGSASYLGALGVQKAKVAAREKQTKTAAQSRQDNIAEMLGIDVEEFELSKEKLANSLMSAGESAKVQLEEIEAKTFGAKTQAYAQRMLKPRFGPALPKPFKTPKTEYVKPLPPIYQTKDSIKAGMGGGYTRPQQTSGLSTALSIGSGIAGVAAAFPGAAPIAAPLSAGLGFLSQLFK